MKAVSEVFHEVVVFTDSHREYADAVINSLKPLQQYVTHRLYAHNLSQLDASCLLSESYDTMSEGGPEGYIKPRNFGQKISRPSRFEHVRFKDFSRLGRDLQNVYAVEVESQDYFKPQIRHAMEKNVIRMAKWLGDAKDRKLYALKNAILDAIKK